ncbi:MAG: hypothetical protein NZM25_10765 [Leptospiraceae bacterium]|nr:hypothetical protein [Leptospiraceae bacterium]MDW8305910.1 hypothetical protein [Leptospiraceae bacterium]
MEEQEEVQEKIKRPILEKAIPIGLGFLSFFAGLLFFFPLEQIARELLLRYTPETVLLDFGDLSLNLWGRFEIHDLRFEHQMGQDKTELILPYTAGSISPLRLLFANKLVFSLKTNSAHLESQNMQVKIGELFLDLELSHIQKNKNLFKGPLHLKLASIIINYQKEVPMLGETLEIPVSFADLKLELEQGVWRIKQATLDSRLVRADITGYVSFDLAGPMELEVLAEPREELYLKYQDKGLREILKSFRLLREDGKLLVHIGGSLLRPQFRAPALSGS